MPLVCHLDQYKNNPFGNLTKKFSTKPLFYSVENDFSPVNSKKILLLIHQLEIFIYICAIFSKYVTREYSKIWRFPRRRCFTGVG